MEHVGWEEFLKSPVGTGPYMVEGVIEDYRNTMEGQPYAALIAYPNYWNNGYPMIKKIEAPHTNLWVKYDEDASISM